MVSKALTRIVRPQAKGRLTIPADFRERLGIDQGTFLQLTRRGSTIEVSPIRLAKEGTALRDFDRKELDAFLEEDKIEAKTATRARRLLSGGSMAAALRSSSTPAISLQPAPPRLADPPWPRKHAGVGWAKTPVTKVFLWEAERNLHPEFPASTLVEFCNLAGQLDPEAEPNPSPTEIHAACKVVAAKDAHVLAGARAGKATHLLTPDRRDSLGKKTRAAILPIVVCTPHDSLRSLVAPR